METAKIVLPESLLRLCASPVRANRDIAVEIALGMESGVIRLVDQAILDSGHVCYLCGVDKEWECENCGRAICEACDGSGVSATRTIDYCCCRPCADFNPCDYDD